MGDRSWPQILSTLLAGHELSATDTDWAMHEIMAGQATDAQLAAFAVLLRAKGETPDELSGLVAAMLDNTSRVRLDFDCADIVGTGGDGAHTVNISTMAAIVVAAGGVKVVKHGNRAASSKSGAADLLEALGVPLAMGPEDVVRCVSRTGIGFCFAAGFHPGMRHAAAPRRDMGVPTAFNFLGPLTNPAQPRAAAIGCADERMAPVMARVLAARGASALVVRGRDGLDELTLGAPTRVWLVSDGTVTETEVDAANLGLARAPVTALRGGDAAFNAEVARRTFAGEPGPVRDAVVLNAGAAFAAFEGLTSDISSNLDEALRSGIDRAADAIDSGAATETLTTWISVATNR